MAKVVLAYSGQLDTTICVYYLRNIRGMKVVTFSANVGQFDYLEPLVEKAMSLGAAAAHIADLREKFVKEYIFPCVRAQAVYEGGYYLFSALARPIIVEELVSIAREEGCDYVAHGSRGIGNDWIRFQNGFSQLAPDLKIIAPLQELKLITPAHDLDYAKKHGIKPEEDRRTLFNIEQNLWGVNIQMRNAADRWQAAPEQTYVLTSPLSDAPSKPGIVELEFREGLPVRLNGEDLGPLELVEHLTKMAGRHGVGRIEMIESRVGGAKTREIYEAPTAVVMYAAHRALESAVLDRETLHYKAPLSQQYADLVYEGKWFSPLRAGLDAFFARINERVTGTVKLSLFKGHVSVVSVTSEYSRM